MKKEKWIEWATEIQAIGQTGLEYCKDVYDKERYERLREIASEIMEQYTQIPTDQIKDLFCNEKGYQTPKVDVRAVIVKDHKILLIKQKEEQEWAIPGGWADFNLSVKENVAKEAKEEAGLIVNPYKIIAIQDRRKHNKPVLAYTIYKIFVLCEVIEGKFEENSETEESEFFELEKLPKLSIDRNTKEQIAMCIEAAENEDWMTIFD